MCEAFCQDVYYIPIQPWRWLAPALELAGIGMQLAGIWLGRFWPLAMGLLLISIGAYLERDPALFAADAAACFGVYYCLKK